MSHGGIGMVFARGDVSGHDDQTIGKTRTTLSTEIQNTNTNIDHQDPSKDITIVSWDGPRDPGNPYNWSLCEKWLLTALAVFATFMTMINGTIITVAHDPMNEFFNISDANFPHSYWPVTSWALGGGCFSLLVLPLMEDLVCDGSSWART